MKAPEELEQFLNKHSPPNTSKQHWLMEGEYRDYWYPEQYGTAMHRWDKSRFKAMLELWHMIPMWIPITSDPKEDGEYLIYRPESDSQQFAYFWCGTDPNGTHGWVGDDNLPLPVEEYSHYYKPLNSPMI